MEELEGHLRDELAALTEAGLTGDEAFLVAVKRMGSLDALSREFARAHSERLWKQLVMAPDAPMSRRTPHTPRRSSSWALPSPRRWPSRCRRCSVIRISPDEELPLFYARNASLFVFPLLAVYFLWKRGSDVASGLWLALPFAAGAVVRQRLPLPHGQRH